MRDTITGNVMADAWLIGKGDDSESRAVINAELSLRMASIADGTADLVDYEDVKRASAEAGRRFTEKQGKL